MWISKKRYKKLIKRMAHIESLLQRMPELIATSICIEKEKQNELILKGQKYRNSVIICPIEKR